MRFRPHLSTRTLIRLARLGQVFCLLMSLSGVLLIATVPEPAQAQGRCASVCSGDDFGACIWCERWEHSGWGTMANIIPDRAVENFVGTGYDALEALSESLGASVGSGELDTTALDNFAERVANRPNADPFAGYAQAAQLIGEETARTDGGNLVSDLQQIYETGAGTEVLNESMSEFQQQVEQGQFGAPLQGLNDLASAASEVIVDPTTTIGQFVDDVRNIYNHGVGDGFWDEALDHTANVIKNSPVAGTIYDGYHQVFGGVAEQGVTGFASEMAEGAYALGQEAYDAAANTLADAANSTYNYIRSWF